MSELSFPSRLREIQNNNEDYEWYPTDTETLKVLVARLKEINEGSSTGDSVLDVGAGDGKVLKYLEKEGLFTNYYVIEKSNTHLNNLPSNYRILGVDFWNTTFIDKTDVTVLFCNPPYSEYAQWIAKILKEVSFSTHIFFLVPERWENNEEIKEALRVRGSEPSILQSYCFENSEDRKARANVQLVEIPGNYSRYDKDDPFQRFFDENFKYPEVNNEEAKTLDKKIEESKLVAGQNLIEILSDLYQDRMIELNKHYASICALPADLLKEFEIKKENLVDSLKRKLANCKKEYWQRLFAGMKNINRTLTTSSQKEVTGVMNAQAGIDFNRENAYAVVMWIIKHGNELYDKQLVEIYKKMLDFANVDNYKSNQRVFKKDNFRYNWRTESQDDVTHVKLKVGHRIVLDRCGGLSNSPYSWEKGLNESAANFIRDLLVIANNMGFDYIGNPPKKGDWNSSEAVEYYFKRGNEQHLLFKVRAYLNQNMHFSFNPEFIHALNVQAGKLMGWVANESEAESEICVDKETAKKFYDYSFRLGEQQLMLN